MRRHAGTINGIFKGHGTLMKIAVQLYGHLRTFRKCAPELKKHVLDHYDADVFIHTWDRTEHGNKSWYSDGVKCHAVCVDEAIVSEVDELYAPKAIKIDAQNLFEETAHFGTHSDIQISLQGMKYMTYGQYMANKLRKDYQTEKNVSYDYVVVIRPDVMPFVPLDIQSYQAEFEFWEAISIHFVHNSEIKIRSNKVFNYPLIADCFYFSKPYIVDKITSIYQDFNYYYKDIAKIFPKQVENPEVAFFENIMQKGIVPRQYVNYFAIKRQNDRDDIKLLPPQQLGKNDQIVQHKCVKIVKKTLEFLSKKSPNFVTQKLIVLFEIMGTCGRYLQALEQRKE